MIRSALICFALKEEAAPLPPKVWGWPTTKVLITGIGRKNAEKSVSEFLADHSPKLVLTCGFAGGLNPDLALGTVIFETSDEKLSAKFLAVGVKRVKFFCADRIATTVAEKKKLRDQTGADAVEMESEAIQAICRERGIPCATVRVISDTAGEDLPLDFNALAKPDLNLDYGKLAWAVARSPGKIGALLKLQKNTRLAAEQLANVLAKISLPPDHKSG